MECDNREAYLTAMFEQLGSDFAAQGYPLPKPLRVTCGWPSRGALRRKNRSIGECWAANASQDGAVEIFISPILADPVEIGAVLVHELVHAAVGPEQGHRGPFKRLAICMGLQGPMRSTHAGTLLRERLNALSQHLGPYPHAPINGMHSKQATRLLKCKCPKCGYTARITRRWIAVACLFAPVVHSWQQPYLIFRKKLVRSGSHDRTLVAGSMSNGMPAPVHLRQPPVSLL